MQVEIRCSDSLPLDVDACTDVASGNMVPEFGILFPENNLYDSHLKDFADKLAKLQCEVDALYARKYYTYICIDKCTSMYSYYLYGLQKEIC
jgi:hypothetical protein